jgi:hypothetical protein
MIDSRHRTYLAAFNSSSLKSHFGFSAARASVHHTPKEKEFALGGSGNSNNNLLDWHFV